MIKTITTQAPEITNFFDKYLLSTATPIMGDNSSTLWAIYTYIQDNLMYKCRNNPRRQEKLSILITQFLEIYGRIKEKEKDLEGQKTHYTQGPFYYIAIPDKRFDKIFNRLRLAGFRMAIAKRRNNHAVQKA